MHGITRAAITKAQAGRWSSGFWSGFASSAFAAPKNLEMANGTAMMAVVGGTVSVISGGKFANGAVSGAFVHMFNTEIGNKDKNEIDLNIEETKKISGYDWYNKVKPDGDWDYKSKIGLEKGEDLGNFNYGATGAAKGFTLGTLLSAAGLVQIYTGTAKLRFDETFFDDPQDQLMIKYGYDYYHNTYKK